MARNYVRTVKDMEDYYYGRGLELQKADSPVLSTHLIYNSYILMGLYNWGI